MGGRAACADGRVSGGRPREGGWCTTGPRRGVCGVPRATPQAQPGPAPPQRTGARREGPCVAPGTPATKILTRDRSPPYTRAPGLWWLVSAADVACGPEPPASAAVVIEGAVPCLTPVRPCPSPRVRALTPLTPHGSAARPPTTGRALAGRDRPERDAITAANSDTAVNGCPAGGGDDTIVFSLSGTITLGSLLPDITSPSPLTIDGTGQGVTVSGNQAVSVMQVDAGATLHLHQLTVANGRGHGGGGIANHGTLTVTNSTFSGNSAPSGGGILNRNGTLNGTLILANTILANSPRGGIASTTPPSPLPGSTW